jgi:hypothetical protein
VAFTWVSRARALKGLGVCVVVVPFAPRPDIIDGVVVALSPVSSLEIITPATASVVAIVTTFTVVVPAVGAVGASVIMVLVAPSVVAVIIAAAGGVVRARESSTVFLQQQVGIRLLLCYLQEVVDGGGPLAEELVPEVVLVAQPFDEC